jgi:hypothetical protein
MLLAAEGYIDYVCAHGTQLTIANDMVLSAPRIVARPVMWTAKWAHKDYFEAIRT